MTRLRTKFIDTLNRTGMCKAIKVSYEGKTYDFGYWPGGEFVVLYEEGCRNMQDAIAVEYGEVEEL